jgi:hypothetical protein
MKEELINAISEGNLPGVKLLVEGEANIAGTNSDLSALELAVITGDIAIVEWLLAEGGAHISDYFFTFDRRWLELGDRVGVDLLTALLRVMVLQSAPPADLLARMPRQHSSVVKEGARLRARLPAYLARRRALLAEHTSLSITLGPGEQLRGAHDDRGALGHGARRASVNNRAAALTHLATHVCPRPRDLTALSAATIKLPA